MKPRNQRRQDPAAVDLKQLFRELSAKHGRDRLARWLSIAEGKGYVDHEKLVRFLKSCSEKDWYK